MLCCGGVADANPLNYNDNNKTYFDSKKIGRNRMTKCLGGTTGRGATAAANILTINTTI